MWQGLAQRIEETMHAEGIADVEGQVFNTMFSQSVATNPRYYRYALWMLYRELKSRDTFGILDRVQPPPGHQPGMVFSFEGRPVSWDLLTSIDALYAISEVDSGLFSEPQVVVDLGAGWGKIGYVLKQVNPRCTYIALDLPEVLLISMTRLPQLLQGELAVDYDTINALPRVSSAELAQGGIWFGGPQHLARFDDGTVDVLINTSSFQEMTPAQVGGYLLLIDKKVRGVFFTQQYWAHPHLKSAYGVIGGFDEYEFPLQWKRCYLRNASFSERYFEAAFRVNQARLGD
jgi:hypothetical protein